MTKYEVIEKIMNSKALNEKDKVWYIERFLKGYFEPNQINWIWGEE